MALERTVSPAEKSDQSLFGDLKRFISSDPLLDINEDNSSTLLVCHTISPTTSAKSTPRSKSASTSGLKIESTRPLNSYIQGMTEAKSAYEGFECYRTSSETLEKTKSFENEVKGHIELSPCNDSSSESQESEESRNDEGDILKII